MTTSSLFSLAQRIEFVVTSIETGQAFTDSNTALEVAAALAQIAGVTAVGGLVEGLGRFTGWSARLSAAISGNRDALAAKGWLTGLGAAEVLSQAIDEFNERGYGADAIEAVVSTSNDFYNAARAFIRSDPLVLDLDGDGIETTGTATNVILFDHDGDGNMSGTGWVKADDALLVLDRNGNGSIDNGAELFGDNTVMSNGQTAVDGFSALRDLDANNDGIFNSSDTQFANVQVWRDLNQNGISESGELQTLANTGIASINLNATVTTHNYGNGNTQSANSTYALTDGTTRSIANLDLQDNPFYRTFADAIPLTAQAQTLPDMLGSGAVRDMREAA